MFKGNGRIVKADSVVKVATVANTNIFVPFCLTHLLLFLKRIKSNHINSQCRKLQNNTAVGGVLVVAGIEAYISFAPKIFTVINITVNTVIEVNGRVAQKSLVEFGAAKIYIGTKAGTRTGTAISCMRPLHIENFGAVKLFLATAAAIELLVVLKCNIKTALTFITKNILAIKVGCPAAITIQIGGGR